VHDLTFAELRGSCLMRYGEQIPTLKAALTMMANETELEGAYLDEKTPEGVLPSMRLVAQLNEDLAKRTDGRKFTALIGIPTDDVLDAWNSGKATLEAEGVTVPPCLLEYDSDKVIAEGCVAWGPTWTEGPQAGNVQKLHEHKNPDGSADYIRTIFWTINEQEFLEGFLTTAKPDGIITARAAMLFHTYQLIGTVPEPRGAQP
jgi:hypothetical protein